MNAEDSEMSTGSFFYFFFGLQCSSLRLEQKENRVERQSKRQWVAEHPTKHKGIHKLFSFQETEQQQAHSIT